MKTLCNIVLLAAAAGGTAARAQTYTTPVTVSNLNCTDTYGHACPGGSDPEDDFYEFYAESDGTCKDSSTPTPIITNPSATAYVYNDVGWITSVQTSMTIASGAGGFGVDAVDSKVSAIVEGISSASGEKEVDCEYNVLVDQPGDLSD